MAEASRPPQAAGRTARILVVDDEEDVREMLIDVLGDEGYRVTAVGDAEAALASLAARPADLVLLDVMLPTADGLDVLTEIRRRSEVPVIFVTGRGKDTDRIVGLRMGADDYVVKPFSVGELVARVQSVLRRSQPRPDPETEPTLEFDGLRIDPVTREVHVGGDSVAMTAKEFDLLSFLAAAPRRVFTREQLLDQVWASRSDWQDPATVTEHVRRIRHKIEKDPDRPRWITTVRGVGYRFEP